MMGFTASGLRHRALVGFGAGAAIICVVLAVLLSTHETLRSGVDNVASQVTIGTLAPGAVACQPHEPVPDGTRVLRLFVARPSSGPPDAAVRISTTGVLPPPGSPTIPLPAGPGASVLVSLPEPVAASTLATVCVENAGSAPVALTGIQTGPADQILVFAPHRPVVHMAGRVRIDALLRARPAPLWDVLGHLPERFDAATGTRLASWCVVIGLAVGLIATVALLWSPGVDGER